MAIYGNDPRWCHLICDRCGAGGIISGSGQNGDPYVWDDTVKRLWRVRWPDRNEWICDNCKRKAER